MEGMRYMIKKISQGEEDKLQATRICVYFDSTIVILPIIPPAVRIRIDAYRCLRFPFSSDACRLFISII